MQDELRRDQFRYSCKEKQLRQNKRAKSPVIRENLMQEAITVKCSVYCRVSTLCYRRHMSKLPCNPTWASHQRQAELIRTI
jgi:hypothetical protein